MASVQVVNQSLYKPNEKRVPVPYGVLDPKMGTANRTAICETCGQDIKECIGHFGYLQFHYPIYHIGYMKNIIEILQRICKSCGRILLVPREAEYYLKRFRNKQLDIQVRKKLFKDIGDKCKKTTKCFHCGELNGSIKKFGAIKLVHEKYKKKDTEAHTDFKLSLANAGDYNQELSHYIPKAQDALTPSSVLELFKRMPMEDVELLDMDPEVSRPEHLILTHIPVPPLVIRPSVPSDKGTTEDDLSTIMARLVHLNTLIGSAISKGEKVDAIMEAWDNLQQEAALYFNSEQPGIAAKGGEKKSTRSLFQRLKGKYGRFRGNLSGKRVDFSGRTVISPDCNLELFQVGVPELQALVLTYPERVNRYNIDRLRRMVINGPDVHPGANFVTHADNPFAKKSLKWGDRTEIAKKIRIGDIVERHLIDGDYVLFNRQPSLHRLSIMCHQAKVLPYRTLRFNPIDCAPYNADFDGDEMNIHLPQTEEARAEAANLMFLKMNMVTPRNGEPVIACNQDFLTAAYKLSLKNVFFDRSEFCMLCTYVGLAHTSIKLPPPVILKPIEMWTGKQIFTLLIMISTSDAVPIKNVRKGKKQQVQEKPVEVLVNLETPAKNYTSGEHMCIGDGYVCFRNSYHISGNLDKKLLGGDSKVSLFYFLMKNYGVDCAAKCMALVARVGSRWLMNQGFSIGIDDVMPSEKVTQEKRKLLEAGYSQCDKDISKFEEGKLEPHPGCNAEQTIETILNKELSEIRNRAGNMCTQELHWLNAPLNMANCGSKGSTMNISQMVACVGQQSVNGARIQNGFINRTLPHFPLFSRKPDAKGFVSNSFFTGLLPTEFFFHTMAGREGLVDTAVKTADTGYMQRRLMKALEDLATQYDNSVRNSAGFVVQFQYGDDLLDPIHMENTEGRPINFGLLLSHIKLINKPQPGEVGLTPEEIKEYIKTYTEGYPSIERQQHVRKTRTINVDDNYNYFKKAAKTVKKSKKPAIEVETDSVVSELPYSIEFVNKLREFMDGYCTKLDKLRKAMEAKTVDKEHWMSMLDKIEKLTQNQLVKFLEECRYKYERAITEPGQAVGALCAQSVGEPGTQMTLKTFHFAGVASMNVTLGVPRIVEIINGTKGIRTPITEAFLEDPLKDLREQKLPDLTHEQELEKMKRNARDTKGRIEATTLGQVALYIEEVYDSGSSYVAIELDNELLHKLGIVVTVEGAINAIINTPKIGIKAGNISQENGQIRVLPIKTARDEKYFSMQHLLLVLPKVVVAGLHSIPRVVVNLTKNDDGECYNLFCEGSDLLNIMGIRGVDGTKSKTNDIAALCDVLGIEAARSLISEQIHYIMKEYSMSIDARHLKLLSDIMTFKGEIMGITRFGIGKMRESTFMLASFERTTDHLFEAAVHTRQDTVEGVSECIIMGIPIGVGTGMFKLMQSVDTKRQRENGWKKRDSIFLDYSGKLNPIKPKTV